MTTVVTCKDSAAKEYTPAEDHPCHCPPLLAHRVKNTFIHLDDESESDCQSPISKNREPWRHARGSLTLSPTLVPSVRDSCCKRSSLSRKREGDVTRESSPRGEVSDLPSEETKPDPPLRPFTRWADVSVSPMPQQSLLFPETPEREVKPLAHFSPGPLPELPSWASSWPTLSSESQPPAVPQATMLQAVLHASPMGLMGSPSTPPDCSVGQRQQLHRRGQRHQARHESPRQHVQRVCLSTQTSAPPQHGKVIPLSAFGMEGFMFEITLRRADGVALGLEVERVMNDRALKVLGVQKSGTVEAWNRQCTEGRAQWKAVMPGDILVKANGALSCNDILEEIRTKLLLQLSIVRQVSTGAPPTGTVPRNGHAFQVKLENQLGFRGGQ